MSKDENVEQAGGLVIIKLQNVVWTANVGVKVIRSLKLIAVGHKLYYLKRMDQMRRDRADG
jgi:hypothetical protein